MPSTKERRKNNMRRYGPPFNGNRYVVNKSTGEIHDLDNETSNCQIDGINFDNIESSPTLENAKISAIFAASYRANGCYYCLNELDNG